MYNYPVKKLVTLSDGEQISVMFCKIPNRQMSAIYRTSFAFIGTALKGLGGGITEIALLAATAETMTDPKVDWLRDIFFENMIVEGYGANLKDGYDRLCDEYGVTVETPLFIEAARLYLGELIPQLKKNIPGFKGLWSALESINLPEKVTEMMKGTSGIPLSEGQ